MSRLIFYTVAGYALVAAATHGFAAAPPPASKERGPAVRVAAEWEPAVGVVIGWPLKLPRSLVVALARDVDLYVTAASKAAAQKARETFAKWHIDPKRIRFVIARQGDGYHLTRDWGPFAVLDGRGDYKLVDGRYLDYPVSRIDSGKRLLWLSKLLGLD
jgi:hypothetical protein